MPDYTTIKGTSDWGNTTFSDQLSLNLTAFFNNAFLNIGAFTNVTLSLSGAYGGDFSRLRAVNDPNFIDGQVFEGVRSQWVYESGISYSYQPISVSGVYVNGIFCPTSGVANSHHIDYPLGRVVFDDPISQSAPVRAEYSYKNVFFTTSEAPWFRTIQTNSFRVDSNQFLSSSGAWDVMAQSRVQLPAVVIEPTTRVTFDGIQLGGGLNRYQDVLFHVVSETPWERNKLVDIVVNQMDKTIYFFDIDRVYGDNVYSLNFDGSINPSGLQYNDLVDPNRGYRNASCLFIKTSAQDVNNLAGLYTGIVRMTCKIPVYNI